MTKELRIDFDDFLADFNARANHRAFSQLIDLFISAMNSRFKIIKDQVEDWKDAIVNEDLLKARLQTIAAKSTYTEDNVIDMALLSMILWNIEDV